MKTKDIKDLFYGCNYIAFLFVYLTLFVSFNIDTIRPLDEGNSVVRELTELTLLSGAFYILVYLLFFALGLVGLLFLTGTVKLITLAYTKLTGKTSSFKKSEKSKNRFLKVMDKLALPLLWLMLTEEQIYSNCKEFDLNSTLIWTAVSLSILLASHLFAKLVIFVSEKLGVMFKRTKAVAA